MTSDEIRQNFIDFFRRHDHTFVPSDSVIPADDPTLLFTNAGMNQFKDIFLGIEKRDYVRAVNSQKCIRVSGKHNDLEEVGKDTYHHTFFEMLGNWSFGDYFKSEAITWAWQLFTDVWGFEPDKLWASVFAGDPADGLPPDTDAEKLWLANTGIPPERVLSFGRKDNFWEMGQVGPCGPCSEIHLDLGPHRCDKKDQPDHVCRVNGGCARFTELWNLVFIQFQRDEKGNLSKLPANHVDTGAGFERIVAVLQKKNSNYDTDLFAPIINHIAEITGKSYTGKLGAQNDNAFRVIADHLRMLTFAIADGATPGNDGRGYVLRRILRRATRFGLLLDMHQPFIYRLVPTLVDIMGSIFPELTRRIHHVENVIQAEEQSFLRTLERGIDIFEADVARLRQENLTELPGEKAFRLYDTYGFPLDLTQLMARERNLTVNVDGFNKLMEQQRRRARASQKDLAYQADALSAQLPATDDSLKYQTDNCPAKLLGYILEDQYFTDGQVPAHAKVGFVFDRTCAYAEAGGQIGDHGRVSFDDKTFTFDDTQRIGEATVHLGSTDSPNISVGEQATIHIDPARRDTRRNHTATHLLQWALQQVLGEHAHQEGSLVGPDYFRFDFTHPRPLTPEQIRQVERLVHEKITAADPVAAAVLPIDQARKLGAMALFSEKYGQSVRVLAIGADNPDQLDHAFSREFCGGTHVANTRDIGSFKIIREESVATGVRRITALTGRALNDMLYQRSDQLEQIAALLKTNPDQLADRIQNLLHENKKLKKQLEKGAGLDLKAAAQKLLDDARTVGETKIIIGSFPQASPEAIRSQIDWLRKKAPSSVTVLASRTDNDRVQLFAAVTNDLIESKNLSAGDIVKNIAPLVGGGGGGRPQLAQAGGKNPQNIPHALDAARKLIAEKL
ncbi:MAG: hypothetical protein AMJ79_10360 [Phycisphaerae bacterium SM23_30]|nr:MAG: hypothetical protein AMJ79_10360 [Phycisphaerae bacterium SM23_30]